MNESILLISPNPNAVRPLQLFAYQWNLVLPVLANINSDRALFRVYIASSKHEEGRENSRQFCISRLEFENHKLNCSNGCLQDIDYISGLHNFREFSQSRVFR